MVAHIPFPQTKELKSRHESSSSVYNVDLTIYFNPFSSSSHFFFQFMAWIPIRSSPKCFTICCFRCHLAMCSLFFYIGNFVGLYLGIFCFHSLHLTFIALFLSILFPVNMLHFCTICSTQSTESTVFCVSAILTLTFSPSSNHPHNQMKTLE